MLLGFGNGVTGGGSLTYQFDKNVFTLRYNEHTSFQKTVSRLAPTIAFPNFSTRSVNHEYALMYGRRKIQNGHSFKGSIGISYNRFEDFQNIRGEQGRITDRIGVPFEFVLRWFKKERRRHRIYMVIPVGKPTSFSRSIGFKFYGNLSDSGFVGLGLIYGFGWHKQY